MIDEQGDIELNRKNGKSGKTLKTSSGNIRINTTGDRSCSFEPQFGEEKSKQSQQ